jgi:hypothetical protein
MELEILRAMAGPERDSEKHLNTGTDPQQIEEHSLETHSDFSG